MNGHPAPGPATKGSTTEAPDASAFRSALRRFPSGVTVVATTTADGTFHAATASSFTSVSLEPPLVLVCLTHGSRTLAAITATTDYSVNVLSEEQEHLARRFADPGRPTSSLECHGLRSSPATLACRLYDVHPAGDHAIIVGEVTGLRVGDEAEPLVFHDGGFRTITG